MTILDRLQPIETGRVEIGSGAELASGAGHHEHTPIGSLERCEGGLQLGPAVEGDRVLALGAVNGQPSDRPPILGAEPGHGMTVDNPDRGYRAVMGFNPFRDHERSTADLVAMVVALVAIFAVLAWAIFSG
jgi:hypothetical protein